MLKSIVADLESVPEAARAFYVERDGRHVLNVEPVEGLALENVNGLKNALAGERRKTLDAVDAQRAAEESLARYGGMDPVAAQAALNRVNADGYDAEVEKSITARIEALRGSIAEAAGTEAKAARAELDTVRMTLTKREAQLQKLALDNVLVTELAKVKPLDDAADALILIAEQHVRMIEEAGELVARVVDGKGEVRLDAKGQPFTISAYMAEMRDTRASLFQPMRQITGLGGSPHDRGSAIGGPGAGQPNPFAKSTWNLTQQVMLTKRNPSLAARFRAEAGIA